MIPVWSFSEKKRDTTIRPQSIYSKCVQIFYPFFSQLQSENRQNASTESAEYRRTVTTIIIDKMDPPYTAKWNERGTIAIGKVVDTIVFTCVHTIANWELVLLTPRCWKRILLYSVNARVYSLKHALCNTFCWSPTFNHLPNSGIGMSNVGRPSKRDCSMLGIETKMPIKIVLIVQRLELRNP